MDRLTAISKAVEEIHRCEREFKKVCLYDPDIQGIWLGYMDWLEELHRLIWLGQENSTYRISKS